MIIQKTSLTSEAKLQDLLTQTKQVGDCLEWVRCFTTDGYARMGGNVKVHRMVYELTTGEDIQGKVVRHTCDNIKCINPLHLISGTNLENIKDRVERDRSYKVITKDKVLRVKALLNLKFLPQKQIAEIVGIDPRRVSDINRGLYNDEGRFLGRG